jgi:hypothetical protein
MGCLRTQAVVVDVVDTAGVVMLDDVDVSDPEEVGRSAVYTSIDLAGSWDKVTVQLFELQVADTGAEDRGYSPLEGLERHIDSRIRMADTAVEACTADAGIDVVAVPASVEQSMLVDHPEYVHIVRLLAKACPASRLAFLIVSTGRVPL